MVEDCVIDNNNGGTGGGVFMTANTSAATVQNCVITRDGAVVNETIKNIYSGA